MSILKDVQKTNDFKTVPQPTKFSVADLESLSNPAIAYKLPLAVIALVDMNAFFAQVEQTRLNLSIDDPVVCVQWLTLIAVSYAARKYGINRMDNVKSAREKCPDVILAHAAVFKKGNPYWSYVDGLPNQAEHKVSLDPYRRESRKIIKIIKQHCDVVEKASVDECYMDLGREVHKRLLLEFPQLRQLGLKLPDIPPQLPESLYWQGETVRTEAENAELQLRENVSSSQKPPASPPTISDWDDICVLIGAQVLYKIRKLIYDELSYTTSGGIARNKFLAKLAAGFNKPDNQTIIRLALIPNFLTNFQFNDVSGMGGKTGDTVLARFDTPPGVNSFTHLRENYSLQDIQKEYPQDPQFAQKIYDIVRGDDKQPLRLRTDVKSMMSRKNFIPQRPVKTLFDIFSWLKVYAGDLHNRFIDLDDENMNLLMLLVSHKEKGVLVRPKTMSLQIGFLSGARISKQVTLPVFRSLDKLHQVVESTSLKLMKEMLELSGKIEDSGGTDIKKIDFNDDEKLKKIKVNPILNCALIVSNFTVTSDSSLIDRYVGDSGAQDTEETIKRMFDAVKEEQASKPPSPKKPKTAKVDNDYITKLFSDYKLRKTENVPKREKKESSPKPDIFARLNSQASKQSTFAIKDGYCTQCNCKIDDEPEHRDYHYALELSEKLNLSQPTLQFKRK